jgi:hypothetical protein
MTEEGFLNAAGNYFEYSLAEWVYLNDWALPSEEVLRYLRVKATVNALFDLWESDPDLAPSIPAARRFYHWRVGAIQEDGSYDDTEINFAGLIFQALQWNLREEATS